MDMLREVLDCTRDSLSWLQDHFNKYGYFEKNYYDVNLCPKSPSREYALNNGRGLWCTAEGTLAFLETFLTIRKCDPVLLGLGIDTNKDWAALEKWMRSTLLPEVISFFGAAIRLANSQAGDHYGLLPNVPERGTDDDYKERRAKVFAVDGTARVLLALCRIRDYWTLDPTQVPGPSDAHSSWLEYLQELIQLSANAVKRSQYTQANAGEAPGEDEGGWRRNVSDEQPCLIDPTCFAILGLFSANPQEYSKEIAAGCDWIRRRGARNRAQRNPMPEASGSTQALGWSWCPQLSQESPDPTSTAFALMALSEALPADENVIREGILYIQEALYSEDKAYISDGLVLRGYPGQPPYFSVLPTLPRTLAALLKCNAVCDSNYYKTGPDKLIANLATEIVERHRLHDGWPVRLTDAHERQLRDEKSIPHRPPDLGENFLSYSHIWYTYTALHALSLFVLYECGQGNLPGWMPAHIAARLGYDLIELRKRSEQALSRTDIEVLERHVSDQGRAIDEVKVQLKELMTHLNNRAKRRRKMLTRVKNLGLKFWKRVLTPVFVVLVVYSIAYHVGLEKTYHWLPVPPTWLTALGAVIVAVTYLDHIFHFLPDFLRVSSGMHQQTQPLKEGERPSITETEAKNERTSLTGTDAAVALEKAGETER